MFEPSLLIENVMNEHILDATIWPSEGNSLFEDSKVFVDKYFIINAINI